MTRKVKFIIKKVILIIIFFNVVQFVSAQTPNINHFFKNYYSKSLHHLDSNFHSSVQPYSPFEVQHLIDTFALKMRFEQNGFIARKLFNENLVRLEGQDFKVFINPIFQLTYGKDSDRKEVDIWRNGRGFQILGELGSRIRFYSDFLENQAQYAGYINQRIADVQVVPGEGLPKKFKNSGAQDFAYVSSFVKFKARQFFDFEFGYGKNFFGDGFRSLLLSDQAFNYPYFKINTTLGKVRYTNLYAQMLDTRFTSNDGSFAKKYVTSHYLSVNLGKRLTVGLFETVVYQDSSNTRGYELSYLNPIIFYRPVEFALGSSGGNVLIGMDLKFKLSNHQFLYGQVVVDEFLLDEIRNRSGWWANKFGFQFGLKSFDTIIPNFTFQTEINTVRPYTYSHTNTVQNYGHYNEPLAHTLGSNFMESLTTLHYFKGRWFGELKLIYALQGLDENGLNWGENIYKDNSERVMDFGNNTLQGIKTTTLFTDMKVGYLLNPTTNLRIELGYVYRNFNPENESNTLVNRTTNYVYFGLVNRIRNSYGDF